MLDPFRSKLILYQAALSILAACSTFAFLSNYWYPSNFMEMFKLNNKLKASLVILIIIGPLMSWLLLKPNKKKPSKILDSSIIVIIQTIFLFFLLQLAAISRPLALVFEVDRIKIITYLDIPEQKLPFTPKWFNPWSFKLNTLPVMGLSKLKTIEETLTSVEQAFNGVDAGQDPKRWISLNDDIRKDILSRATPISTLINKYPESAPLVKKVIDGKLEHIENAQWIPIVSRHTYEWVAILHPGSAELLGIIPYDGFID